MKDSFPNIKTIRAATESAIRAPSLHNCQPWSWRLDDHALHLYVDRDRALPNSDSDGREVFISCGIALQHMRIAFSSLGWSSNVERLPDADDIHHVASMTFRHRSPLHHQVELATAIARRRTDRRRYSSWPVPEAHLMALVRSAASEGIVVERMNMSSVFRHAASTATEIHNRDSRYRAELAAWNCDENATGGIPAANVPAEHASASPVSASMPNRAFPRHDLVEPSFVRPSEDSSAVLLVGTPGDDRASQIRAGEATGDILLEATTMGLATSVYTEALEPAETRRAIQRQVSTTHCFPQVIIRTGWAPVDAPPIPPTPRRPLDDVLRNVSVDPSRSSPDSTPASF